MTRISYRARITCRGRLVECQLPRVYQPHYWPAGLTTPRRRLLDEASRGPASSAPQITAGRRTLMPEEGWHIYIFPTATTLL